jgi:hypothetical protein
MFELGLRLAFDKPTIIVKDDKTAYSFDTSAIEHIDYPRDLRFSRIVEFKEKLSEKIKSTHHKACTDPSYTTFLKHFGEFTVAKIDKKEVSGQEYLLEELKGMRQSMARLERLQYMAPRRAGGNATMKNRATHSGDVDVCLRSKSEAQIAEAVALAASCLGVKSVELEEYAAGHKHLIVKLDDKEVTSAKEVESLIRRFTRSQTSATASPD